MLKLQYFGQLMLRADSLEKTLMLGKVEGKKQRGQQGMKCLDSITDSMDISLSKLKLLQGQASLACCSPWGRRVRYELVTQQQVNILRRMRKYYKYFLQSSSRRH